MFNDWKIYFKILANTLAVELIPILNTVTFSQSCVVKLVNVLKSGTRDPLQPNSVIGFTRVESTLNPPIKYVKLMSLKSFLIFVYYFSINTIKVFFNWCHIISYVFVY